MATVHVAFPALSECDERNSEAYSSTSRSAELPRHCRRPCKERCFHGVVVIQCRTDAGLHHQRGNIPIVSHRLPNLHFDEVTTYIFNKPENRALGGEESADGTSKIRPGYMNK
jgi:hypothetical protein